MLALIVRRIVGASPTLLLVCLISFSLLYLIPGDPAAELSLDDRVDDEDVSRLPRLGRPRVDEPADERRVG